MLQQCSFHFFSILLCSFSCLQSINCRLPALLVNNRQHKHLHQLHQLLLFLAHLDVKLLLQPLDMLLLRWWHC
jgi:hypothetical protein